MRSLAQLSVRLNPALEMQLSILKNKIASAIKNEKTLPQNLIRSIIEIEDKRYFHHLGVDFYSILRAIHRNITSNRLEGASTIEQQLVRNLTNKREVTVKRKIKEIVFATLISREFAKNEILFAYMSSYRFNSFVGIFTFCEKEEYDLKGLSINQSAQIAARFKYPALNKLNYIKYLKRVRTIEIKTASDAISTVTSAEEMKLIFADLLNGNGRLKVKNGLY